MAAELPIEGISVGHYSDLEGLTGCTAVLAPRGRGRVGRHPGGAPGTLETALLSPYASVAELHAVLLTGGSAPGLAAAAGVTAFLQEDGYGYQTPFAKIPLVSRGGHLRPRARERRGLPERPGRLPGGCRRRVDRRGGVGGCRHRGDGRQDAQLRGMMKGGVGLASCGHRRRRDRERADRGERAGRRSGRAGGDPRRGAARSRIRRQQGCRCSR